MAVLEFEKPIFEIQKKIDEFKKMSLESGMDFNNEIEKLEEQANEIKSCKLHVIVIDRTFWIIPI